MDDNLQICIDKNITDFAQFLASQPQADMLKKEFDKAYQIARYEVKRKEKCKGRWMKVSECPKMSNGT